MNFKNAVFVVALALSLAACVGGSPASVDIGGNAGSNSHDVRGRPTPPVHLSLIGVAIDAPEPGPYPVAFPDPGARLANTAAEYTVFAHTDDPALAQFLGKNGVPIELVPIAYSQTPANDTAVVYSLTSGYQMVTDSQFEDVVFGPHDHYDQFWFGSGDHAREVVLVVHDARDHDCTFNPDKAATPVTTTCEGVVTSPPDSPVARFLGGPKAVDTELGARHHKIGISALYLGVGKSTNGGAPCGALCGVPAGPPDTSLLPQPDEAGADVLLEGCYISASWFHTTPAHIRAYVPGQYVLYGDPFGDKDDPANSPHAVSYVWDLACDVVTLKESTTAGH